MKFSGLSARDLPAPATLAEDAATFLVPVFGWWRSDGCGAPATALTGVTG